MPFILEILIPTYNRSSALAKNLNLLAFTIRTASLEKHVLVRVSDNASADSTKDVVAAASQELGISIAYTRNTSNIGLEPNVVNLLAHAQAPYIMFLGDDDYLPHGYLEHVIRSVSGSGQDSPPLAFIPGFSGLLQDGTVRPTRVGRAESTRPSIMSAVRLAPLGHQLSGLVFPRAGLYETYISEPRLRNIYPFVFFLGYTLKNYRCHYLPHFQVLVSQGNAKDWEYDDSGLLSEVAKAYRGVFGQTLWYTVAMAMFIWRNPWRLRVGPSLRATLAALRHLAQQEHVGLSVLALTHAMMPAMYARSLVGRIIRRIRRWPLR